MKRFKKLILPDKEIESVKLIEQYLSSSEFSWILECEVDDVVLEIDTTLNILKWKSGIFYWGIWHWGVFESGEFRSGDWLGGIFLNGIFNGNWKIGWRENE
jgi:hypothetical protein